MAIAQVDVFTRLERECKAAYEAAMQNGECERAKEIRNYFEQRKYDMDGDYMNSMLGQSLATGTGIGQIGATNGIIASSYQSVLTQQAQTQAQSQLAQAQTQWQNIEKADFKPEFGVLYLRNKELPADWAGAKITEFQRRPDSKWWHLQFISKWDKALEINLYLDIEEYSGTQINEMARTYIEALNQRRVG